MASRSHRTAAMTQDEKDYFELLGSRVAQLRKDQGPTQVQLAEARAKHGPVPTLARHMERISALPKTQQKSVIQVIETVLAQQGR